MVYVGYVWAALVLLLLTTNVAPLSPPCDDIDVHGCANNHQLCADPVLAEVTCPRTCHKCPFYCLHCDNVVADAVTCKNKTICPNNKVCMLRHKVSIIDGHQEYTLQCVDKMVCDSRRALGKRDVTTHCCSGDFCNDPNPRKTPLTTATTTTLTTLSTQAPINQIAHRTCARDIVFIVDESIGSGHTFGREAGKQFIHNIVSAFTIGHDHTLMALFTTSLVSLKVWGFQSYTSQSSLLRAIDDLNVKIGFIANINDPMAGIHAYVDQTRSGEIQNRPNVPDVVIVMTWENWDPKAHFLLTGSYPEYYLPSFHSLTRNVIALGAGNDVSDTQLQQIATNGHWFRIQNENELFSAQNEVTRIICE